MYSVYNVCKEQGTPNPSQPRSHPQNSTTFYKRVRSPTAPSVAQVAAEPVLRVEVTVAAATVSHQRDEGASTFARLEATAVGRAVRVMDAGAGDELMAMAGNQSLGLGAVLGLCAGNVRRSGDWKNGQAGRRLVGRRF